MKKIFSKMKDNRYIFLSFFLTAVICCIVYKLRNVSPFGSESILRVDLFHQYAPFLEELRSRIVNGQSLFYSWEAGLGKDFLTQMAYYTASPLDFLVLLFPESAISEFIVFLITLKTCLCSAGFAYYLKKHFDRNDYTLVMFGLLYAFCGFMTCYYWNVMWLDTVALFPLVIWGVEKIVKENKAVFYFFTLTLTMIVNFYLAVLVCVFTALFYLVILFSTYSWKNNYKVIIQRTLRFGITSILCALSAMFILLPVVIALGQTSTSETAFPTFDIYNNIYQIITCHFIGFKPSVLARNEDLPNVFCGVFTLLLLPVYFFNKRIPRKDKLLRELLMLFFLLCCIIRPLDFLIHGLHFPSNLPHRFTFMYSFLLLVMAYEAMSKLKECAFRWILISYAFYAFVIWITEYELVPRVWGLTATLSDQDVIINLVLMAVYVLILFLLQKELPVLKKLLPVLIFAAIIGECIFTAYDGLDDTGDRDAYVAYLDDTQDAMAAIDAQDDDFFYRTEFRRLVVINEGSIHHFNGFSQFSSLAPGGISSFIKNVGVSSTGNSYRYYDPTPLVDAIFNMKYLLNRDTPLSKNQYTEIGQFGSIYAYKNERTLSLGFLVDTDLENWNMEAGTPFLVQNEFVRLATDVEQDMFTPVEVDYISTENLDVTSGTYNDFSYSLTDPSNLAVIPRVTAQYTSDKDQYLYLYVDAGNASRFIYHTSRENQDRELACGNSIIEIGQVYAGEVITIEFELTKRGEFELQYRSPGTVRLYAASYDDSVFQAAYDELSQGNLILTSFEDTHLEGTVHAEEDSILFTSIPYVDGWTVTVDGQAVDKISIGENGVIGVPVSAGDHVIAFSYRLKGFTYAVIITLMGLVLMFFYTRWMKKHKTPRPEPEVIVYGKAPRASKRKTSAKKSSGKKSKK